MGKIRIARQEKFCMNIAYGAFPSQVASMIDAGYSANGATGAAGNLLKTPKIAKRISELQDEIKLKLSKKYEITQERILKERARIAFFNLAEIFNEDGSLKSPGEWGENAGAVLSGVKTRVEFDKDGGSLPAEITDVKVINKENSLLALEKMWGMYEEHNKQKRLVDTSKMGKKELITYARELLSNLEPKQITNQN